MVQDTSVDEVWWKYPLSLTAVLTFSAQIVYQRPSDMNDLHSMTPFSTQPCGRYVFSSSSPVKIESDFPSPEDCLDDTTNNGTISWKSHDRYRSHALGVMEVSKPEYVVFPDDRTHSFTISRMIGDDLFRRDRSPGQGCRGGAGRSKIDRVGGGSNDLGMLVLKVRFSN